MTTLRRFLALCALLFWQGGFTFYAAVVIPVAGRVLHDNLHLRARITDQATSVLNYAGVVAVALLLWEFAAAVDPSHLRRRLRGGSWLVLVVTLAALLALHYRMDQLDPPEGTGPPSDPETFFLAHSAYIWVSTAQWLAALLWLAVAMRSWRVQDSQRRQSSCGAPHPETMKMGAVADILGDGSSPDEVVIPLVLQARVSV